MIIYEGSRLPRVKPVFLPPLFVDDYDKGFCQKEPRSPGYGESNKLSQLALNVLGIIQLVLVSE
jgi:hypothetical protein